MNSPKSDSFLLLDGGCLIHPKTLLEKLLSKEIPYVSHCFWGFLACVLSPLFPLCLLAFFFIITAVEALHLYVLSVRGAWKLLAGIIRRLVHSHVCSLCWSLTEILARLSAGTSPCDLSMWPELPCDMAAKGERWDPDGVSQAEAMLPFITVEITQHHVYHILFVEADIKSCPSSRKVEIGSTSWGKVTRFWKSMGGRTYCCGHFGEMQSATFLMGHPLLATTPRFLGSLGPLPTSTVPRLFFLINPHRLCLFRENQKHPLLKLLLCRAIGFSLSHPSHYPLCPWPYLSQPRERGSSKSFFKVKISSPLK